MKHIDKSYTYTRKHKLTGEKLDVTDAINQVFMAQQLAIPCLQTMSETLQQIEKFLISPCTEDDKLLLIAREIENMKKKLMEGEGN